MLASLLKKAKSSPVEQISAYSASSLNLEPTDLNEIINQRQKSNNFPLLGTTDVHHFKFSKLNFRILVLEDTGNLLSYDRYYVLYDSDIENRRQAIVSLSSCSSKNSRNEGKMYNQKEIKQLAQYLFGSGFQGELKQTSRIHCEPKDLGNNFKNKTLVVRTYHFDANFEYSQMKKTLRLDIDDNFNNYHSNFHLTQRNASLSSKGNTVKSVTKLNVDNDPNLISIHNSASPSHADFHPNISSIAAQDKKSKHIGNHIDNDDDIKNWDIEPSTKIDFDFGSKNNTPIGICIVLPFSSDELFQTVGTNYAEFEKWLYEIQDLTLKYLKNYFHLQAEYSLDNSNYSMYGNFSSSSSVTEDKNLTDQQKQNMKMHANRYFKVDNKQLKKIHFNKLLLQKNFEHECVFNNYYNRINIFMNTPRIITGITHLEKNLKLHFLKDSETLGNLLDSSTNLDAILYKGLCKEIREWLAIQDLSNTNHESYFLATLLSLLLPIRKKLVNGKPADKKKQVVRLILAGNNDTVSYRLLSILSCFLPDVIFKFDILNEKEFDKIRDEVNDNDSVASHEILETSESSVDSVKLSKNLMLLSSNSSQKVNFSKENTHNDSGISSHNLATKSLLDKSSDSLISERYLNSTDAVDSLKTMSLENNSKESVASTCNSIKTNLTEKSNTLSSSSTMSNNSITNGYKPYTTSNKHPMVPRTRGSGLCLMSPKAIPFVTTTTGYSNLFLDNGFYGSSAKSFGSYGCSNNDHSTAYISGNNLNANCGRKVSEPNILKNNGSISKESRIQLSLSQPSFDNTTLKPSFKRVMSVTDLTQTSMNSTNAEIKSRLKKINFITRSPTAILKIHMFKYSSFKSKKNNLDCGLNRKEAKYCKLKTGLGIVSKGIDNSNEPMKGMVSSNHVIDKERNANESEQETINSIINIEEKRNNEINRILSIDNENYMKEIIEKIMYNSDDIEMTIDEKFNAAIVSLKSDINEDPHNEQVKEQFLFDDYSSHNLLNQSSSSKLSIINANNDDKQSAVNSSKSQNDFTDELFLGNYFSSENDYGNLLLPSTEIPLPPIVGITNEFFPEFSIQIVNNKLDSIKNKIRVVMKQDLFHNEFVDKCMNNCEKDMPILRTIFVNIDSKEISELELKLSLGDNECCCQNQECDSNISRGSTIANNHVNNNNATLEQNESGSYSSLFSFLKPSSYNNNTISSTRNSRSSGMISSSSSSDGSYSLSQSSSSVHQQSQSTSEISNRPPLISNRSVLSLFDFSKASSKMGKFVFEGKKFSLLDEKIFEEKRGLVCNNKIDLGNIVKMDNILKKLASIS